MTFARRMDPTHMLGTGESDITDFDNGSATCARMYRRSTERNPLL